MASSVYIDPKVELQNREVYEAVLGKLQGGGSGGGGNYQQATKDAYQRSRQYFDDPALARGAGQALGGVAGQQAQGYSQFVDNPTASPAYQNALSGMLAALVPGEQQGRRDLADVFRAAGNTASSSFGEAANKYQQGVDRNRMSVASDLLAKLYPQIAGAKFAPISQIPDLINANKLEESMMNSREQSTSVPSDSGGVPGGLSHGTAGGGSSLGIPGGGSFNVPRPMPAPDWFSGGYQAQPPAAITAAAPAVNGGTTVRLPRFGAGY